MTELRPARRLAVLEVDLRWLFTRLTQARWSARTQPAVPAEAVIVASRVDQDSQTLVLIVFSPALPEITTTAALPILGRWE